MDLHMYSICTYLSPDILEAVEKAFFFDTGDAALLLTFDGALFAVNKVLKSYLSGGVRFIPKKLLQVVFPGDIKILDFATRGAQCAALSRGGSVFQWEVHTEIPERVTCLKDLCVVQISSGEDFFMALCMNGQVYAWKGVSFSCYRISPRDEDMIEVDYSPTVVKLDGIHRPILLTEGGKIYVPEQSFDVSLAPFIQLKKAVEMPSSKMKIIKLVCGKFRVFVLSSEGALYTWNEYKCDTIIQPECIAAELGRLIDIRAPLSVDEVIVMDKNGDIFKVFKQYGAAKLWNSEQVKLKTFNEYEATQNLANYGRKESFDIPVNSSNGSKISRAKWLRKWIDSFNNPENSDLTFVVEGKMIYAHQMVLYLQCNGLRKILSQQPKDPLNRIIMPIEHVSHSTYYRFIKFLYHGHLTFGSHQGNTELLKLVHEYDYDPLMELCQEIVINGIQEDNACTLYALASKLGLKRLKKESLIFIKEHLENMIKKGYYDGLGGSPDDDGNGSI